MAHVSRQFEDTTTPNRQAILGSRHSHSEDQSVSVQTSEADYVHRVQIRGSNICVDRSGSETTTTLYAFQARTGTQ